MSYNLDFRPQMSLQTPDEKQTGLFLHLSQLLGLFVPLAGIVVPIVIWQMQKNKMPALDAHGKIVANWMFSSVIYTIGCILFFIGGILSGSSLFFLALLPILALAICSIVFPIIGGIKANNGELWEYPLTIKFLK